MGGDFNAGQRGAGDAVDQRHRPEAMVTLIDLSQKLERAKGFEPSTPTLARLCSTPELRPLSGASRMAPGGEARD